MHPAGGDLLPHPVDEYLRAPTRERVQPGRLETPQHLAHRQIEGDHCLVEERLREQPFHPVDFHRLFDQLAGIGVTGRRDALQAVLAEQR
jgi:hypothetical protein